VNSTIINGIDPEETDRDEPHDLILDGVELSPLATNNPQNAQKQTNEERKRNDSLITMDHDELRELDSTLTTLQTEDRKSEISDPFVDDLEFDLVGTPTFAKRDTQCTSWP